MTTEEETKGDNQSSLSALRTLNDKIGTILGHKIKKRVTFRAKVTIHKINDFKQYQEQIDNDDIHIENRSRIVNKTNEQTNKINDDCNKHSVNKSIFYPDVNHNPTQYYEPH